MIRFGTKTLLFAFVLVALWCSTFSGYAAGRDVRASVLLIVFLAAGYAAVYNRGRARAFWSGLFVVMLLTGGGFISGQVNRYVPNFYWRLIQPTQTVTIRYPATTAPVTAYSPYAPTPAPIPPTYSNPLPGQPIPPMAAPVMLTPVVTNDYEFTQALNDSIATLWTLVLGLIVGLIGIWIYGSISRELRISDN